MVIQQHLLVVRDTGSEVREQELVKVEGGPGRNLPVKVISNGFYITGGSSH